MSTHASISVEREVSPGYQIAMLVLSVAALVDVGIQSMARLDPQVVEILDYADVAVCAIFFVDFLLSLWHAPDRLKYMLTWGWIDALSSVPTLDFARWGRVARVFRVLRVLRALRATRILSRVILKRRAENAALAAMLGILLLVTFASIAILQFEDAPESKIRTAQDAVWWAVTTVTTVGYGDLVPVTGEGRVVAAILMVAGVALFTTLSGLLASWFLAARVEDAHTLAALHAEIAELRKLVESLKPDRS